MEKKYVYITLLKFIGTISIGCLVGAYAMAIYLGWYNFSHPDPWVMIEVHNQSSQDIVGILVENKSGRVNHSGMKKDTTITIPIYHTGEGNYSIVFTMKDGSICSSGDGYVESGYERVEWVTDNGAINEMYKKLGNSPKQCTKPIS